jgi:catechol 2,3-dioxygenase-like lactoylglutathione lyase family enzyme
MQLDHFNIAAPMDLLETTRDFYVSVLGFEEGFRPVFSRRGFWLYSGERPSIHLIESERHFASEKQGFLDHIAFRASGLDATRKRLEQYGVDYRQSYISEFEMTQLFFRDPAGTGLEINFPGES